MNKEKIILDVPESVRFLGEIKGFELPNGIFNKVVTGCGATTVALKDKYPTILVAPRKGLLKNKSAQLKNVFWVQPNEKYNLKDWSDAKSKNVNRIFMYQDKLEDYLKNESSPKLLVTYDSFDKLKNYLGDSVKNYRVVVDEFHRMLQDASFKADVIYKLSESLKDIPYVTFLSATPISQRYTELTEYFSSLDYYELNWKDIEYVKIQPIITSNPVVFVKKILKLYQIQGYFTLIDNESDAQIKSEHVFVFINSVSSIINIIKSLKLKAKDVNILISDTPKNVSKLKALGKSFEIGSVPLFDEEVKPITFCTSTAFDGVDFYCKDSLTLAVSEATRENTLLDVITDLPQIAGRQRLDSNPLYNKIYFIYNELSELDFTDEKIIETIRIKEKVSRKKCEEINSDDNEIRQYELESWDKLSYRQKLRYHICIDKGRAVYNEFIKLADLDSMYLVQDYFKNGIKVKARELKQVQVQDRIFKNTSTVLGKVYNASSARGALRKVSNDREFMYILNLLSIFLTKEQIDLYNTVGFKKAKALDFNIDKIKNYSIVENINKEKIKEGIRVLFIDGFASTQEIKVRLTSLYNMQGYVGVISAKKIEELFPTEVKKTSKIINGNRIYGYKLLS